MLVAFVACRHCMVQQAAHGPIPKAGAGEGQTLRPALQDPALVW